MTEDDLAAALDERRLELGMRWEDVADAAGMSYETIRNLRLGRPMRPLTKAKLERALRLKRGSIDARVLAPLDEPSQSSGDAAPQPTKAELRKLLIARLAAAEAIHPELHEELLKRTVDALPDDKVRDLLDGE